jgi:hypothetical protein
MTTVHKPTFTEAETGLVEIVIILELLDIGICLMQLIGSASQQHLEQEDLSFLAPRLRQHSPWHHGGASLNQENLSLGTRREPPPKKHLFLDIRTEPPPTRPIQDSTDPCTKFRPPQYFPINTIKTKS